MMRTHQPSHQVVPEVPRQTRAGQQQPLQVGALRPYEVGRSATIAPEDYASTLTGYGVPARGMPQERRGAAHLKLLRPDTAAAARGRAALGGGFWCVGRVHKAGPDADSLSSSEAHRRIGVADGDGCARGTSAVSRAVAQPRSGPRTVAILSSVPALGWTQSDPGVHGLGGALRYTRLSILPYGS